MQIDPKVSWGHEHLAWSLNFEGDIGQGIAEARLALQQDPDDAAAHDRMAWALNLQGKPAEAEPEARKAIQLDPRIVGTMNAWHGR